MAPEQAGRMEDNLTQTIPVAPADAERGKETKGGAVGAVAQEATVR